MTVVADNPLAVQIREAQISESDSAVLLPTFMPFFQKANEWAAAANAIVVTDVNDKETMKKAREARLAMKEIRVSVEKARKELKEESLRKGKAIDGMANVIKFLIVPIEEHLEKQENFARVQEEQRLQAIKEARTQELSQYVADVSFYDLAAMPEDTYTKLLESSKAAHEASQEAARKAEEERVAKAQAEAAEQERIREENAKLRQEAQEREAKLQAERKERERIEAEARAKEEAEAARIKAEKAAARREKLAPDKDKLVALADRMTAIPMPEVSSDEAKAVIENAIELLNKASQYVKTRAINL